MYHECRHVMPSGLRCQSPAMRKKSYCYYHDRLHRATEPNSKFDDFDIKLPPLEDLRSIQIALTQVLSFICRNQIDARRGALLLRGLQMAERVVTRIDAQAKVEKKPDKAELVDWVNDAGMAEEMEVCTSTGDCSECPEHTTCEVWARMEKDQQIREQRLREDKERKEREEQERMPAILHATASPPMPSEQWAADR
jgi:hypothetical protein